MMIETLKTLPDEELQAVIAFAEEQLKERDRLRKDTALEQASAILKAAGLRLHDIGRKGRQKGEKAPVYKAGQRYQHPARPELVWTASGKKPNWLRNVEAEGRRAVELAPEHANDNAENERVVRKSH